MSKVVDLCARTRLAWQKAGVGICLPASQTHLLAAPEACGGSGLAPVLAP